MNFRTMYLDELDRELGSADRSELFTLERRKAAINAGMKEFAERTDCYVRDVPVPLVDGQQEYPLEADIPDFTGISSEDVSILIVSGTTARYIEGGQLKMTTPGNLNLDVPGWRSNAAGYPRSVYLDTDGGQATIGFYPAPRIVANNPQNPDVWVAIVRATVVPDDMVADSEEPFAGLSTVVPYHRAIVNHAAYDLEKFRKDPQRMQFQLELFESLVVRYEAKQRPKRGAVMRMARDYRQRRGMYPPAGAIVVRSTTGAFNYTRVSTVLPPPNPVLGELWWQNADPTYYLKVRRLVLGVPTWVVLTTITL